MSLKNHDKNEVCHTKRYKLSNLFGNKAFQTGEFRITLSLAHRTKLPPQKIAEAFILLQTSLDDKHY